VLVTIVELIWNFGSLAEITSSAIGSDFTVLENDLLLSWLVL